MGKMDTEGTEGREEGKKAQNNSQSQKHVHRKREGPDGQGQVSTPPPSMSLATLSCLE